MHLQFSLHFTPYLNKCENLIGESPFLIILWEKEDLFIMPYIYLSPSTQPYNTYVTGGNEQTWMNLLADHMEPYLTASGIQYLRKSPNMSAADAIRQSNAGTYDLLSGVTFQRRPR